MKFRNNISILDQYTSGAITKIVFYLLGIILLSISSKISIPFFPVPMTLQTFVVYFIAASMGMVGFYSTISYVALGLMGLPIFAAGGGIAYIMSPTFGFLYGMILASFFIAYLSKNLFNKKILDPMSGFFILKKRVYKNTKKDLVLLGYKILIDILLSYNRKIVIKEVVIDFRVRDKGFSKMRLKILLQLILLIIFKYFKR